MDLLLQHPPVNLQDQMALADQCHRGFLMALEDLCPQENLQVQVDHSGLKILAGQCCLCHLGHQLLQLGQEIRLGLGVQVIH